MNLSTLKEQLSQKWVLYPLLIIGLLLILGLYSLIAGLSRPQQTIKEAPLPVSEQPVSSGKFESEAPVAQKSKTSIEKLLPELPHREVITTSTGKKITFVILSNKRDLYDLYIEIAGINFQITETDPNFPKTVLEFRETASTIFNWINKRGVQQSDIFVIWGNAITQKAAESWLQESEKYPKVVKKDNTYIFEGQAAN